MNISKVYYQRNFRIGDFQYETIGIGIDINENEDAKQALYEAKRLVIEYNADQNHPTPHIEEKILPEIYVEKKSVLNYADQIRASKSIEELNEFKIISDMNPKLTAIYNETFNQLTNK